MSPGHPRLRFTEPYEPDLLRVEPIGECAAGANELHHQHPIAVPELECLVEGYELTPWRDGAKERHL